MKLVKVWNGSILEIGIRFCRFYCQIKLGRRVLALEAGCGS